MAKGGKGILGCGKLLSFILAWILGPILPCIERIIRGKVLQGILYIITGGYFGIGWIVDIILIIVKNDLWIF